MNNLKTDALGLVALRPGDFVKVQGETVLVDHVNGSGARVVPLAGRTVTVKTRFGDEATFNSPGRKVHISAHVPPELVVDRRGAQWLADFLSAKAAGRKETAQAAQQETTETESEATMGRKKKEVTAEAANGAPRTKGKLGEIFGFSTTSVLRRLGMAGVSVAHARAIMAARGHTVAPATVQIQVGDGKRGKGSMAEITKDQLKELVDSAPEPAKGGGEAKPKAKRGGRKAKSEEQAAAA